MKQNNLFRSGARSLIMGTTFLMLLGMFSCQNSRSTKPDDNNGKKEKIEITYSVVGENGTLTARLQGATGDLAPSPVKVEKDSTVVFTAKPNKGFKVKSWKKDGNPVSGKPENSYTLKNINKNVDVRVEFEKDEITITFSSTPKEGGSLTAKIGEVEKHSGDKIERDDRTVVSFMAKANEGYVVGEWTGVLEGANKGVKTANALAKGDINVTVTFVKGEDPNAKKKAEITFVSIKKIEWDKANKTIKFKNPISKDITIGDVQLKAKSTNGSIPETMVKAIKIEPKDPQTDKLKLGKGESTTLIVTSEETETLESAKVEVIVRVITPLTKVDFTKPVVTSKDAKNKEQEVVFEVKYPEFELSTKKEYIDAMITRTDDDSFPEGAKIKVKYESKAKGDVAFTQGLESPEWTISGNNVYDLFGCYPFNKGMIKHTELNKNHIGLTERYTMTITLPETVTKDIEIKVISALFADSYSFRPKQELEGKAIFTLKGVTQ